MQDALRILSDYWTERGCMVVQPFNTEVGAGTMNPATVLRVLGPEPWDVAYVEPSVRPDDSRYGENPNRLQMHTQFQVILKPDPGNPQELYLGSLEALGIDLAAHDVRFVEDNWAQPAIGAWGLGWEVWLDGMEITQFTYFQQVGGQNLDPIPVELTYGLERILMAVQGATHFKQIAYSRKPSGEIITYGEAFGQNEYEMSRYYLDDADVDTNRRLYEAYVAEATRMVEARLPVPAHTYVLKSSHAFNVLDARGAISTTERAKAFATMRRLMRDTAALWIERREELGLPLLKPVELPELEVPTVDASALGDQPRALALEIGVEELPPHVVGATVEQVRTAVTERLAATRLEHGEIRVDGTPRRIVVTVADVAAREPDTETLRKGPKWQAAYDASGAPTKALEGFARGAGVTVDQVERAEVQGGDHAVVRVEQVGRGVMEVLPPLLAEVVTGLRAEKNMRWNDPSLSFSRAIRWLVALWGDQVVPVVASRLVAGRETYLQRGEGTRADGVRLGHATVAHADELLDVLAAGGIELATERRRASIVEQAERLAAEVGGRVDTDAESALVDQITNLVEEPHGVRGDFDPRYLDLPAQILTTVMRKHQRYLPVLDASGALLPHFVTMANGACDDAVVKAGNESVIRARYEDALFFWNADLEAERVDEFVPGLEKLTFEERLGSVGERARRIKDVALALSSSVDLSAEDRTTLERAGSLAKFDLATQLVVEMSSLAGFVAREYAGRKGETPAVADALAEMEMPHTAADALPASVPGALLSLADRSDLVMAMFALGAKPTGSSDPFGVRRACLGILRVLRDQGEVGRALSGLSVRSCLEAAADRLRQQDVEVSPESVDAALEFTTGRFAQLLRDEGVAVSLIDAVLPGAATPGAAAETIRQAQELRGDEGFRSIVASLQRIGRIVPEGTEAAYDATRLTEPAEVALVAALEGLPEGSSRDLETFATQGKALVDPVARFFDDILVMAPDPQVRAARLGLLASVRAAAPDQVDWSALATALA
ncbi:glycine--tRNA ligase [Arsenicicoccus dermatophilus]|uniref:glycine--tRNA ligase n=1 Tax=Arsenicicoccus dermatophilus TaxID=1076331 RepID=UPI001F4CD8BC|nr:glycine--tRNA ligase [Arsenicicoccus dermatophilus]MCH8612226.1 glycine--tRNA ligase [Arsenicicoccus dermatophilus]